MAGYGTKGFFGISAQQSLGTATESFDYMTIISESLTTEIEDLVEGGTNNVFEEGESHEGLITITGDVVFEPHPVMIGHFLRGVTGQASSTAVNSAFNWEFLPRQVDFDTNVAVPPFTMQIFRDVGSSWQFTDAVINSLVFEVTASQLVQCTANIMAITSSLMDPTTPAFPEGKIWKWDSGSISLDGSADSNFETLTIEYNNNLEGVPTINNTRRWGKILRGDHRQTNISGTVCFASQTEYNKFRVSSEQAFVATFTNSNQTIAQSYNPVLKFDVPRFRYTTYPVNISGPGRLTVDFEAKAKYDSSSLYAIDTTLTTTKTSYAN